MVAFNHVLLMRLSVNYCAWTYYSNFFCFFEGADFDFVFDDLKVVEGNDKGDQATGRGGEESCAPDVMWRVFVAIKVDLILKF